jgi:hypothetical protein
MQPDNLVTGVLCQKCQQSHFKPAFFRTWMGPEGGSFEYHCTLEELQSSVLEYSCNWCSLVLHFVKSLIGEQPSENTKNVRDIGEDDRADLFRLKVGASEWKGALSFTEKLVKLREESFPVYRNSRMFSAIAEKGKSSTTLALRKLLEQVDSYMSLDNEAAKYIEGRYLVRGLRSREAFTQAKLWLEDCMENHPTCSRTLESSFFPARIIELGQHDTERIFVRSEMLGNDGIKYLALSYCWGGEANFKTTTTNIDLHEKEGIRILDLPKTVQDAIICTREIGLHYLWVDALCIIQDSELDKKKQIPQIRSIFKNATCTIVAANSKTVFDGFLDCRAPTESSGPLPYFAIDGKIGTFRLVSFRINEYSEEPVNTRAWTLEEALLSRGLLIYSSGTLLWECQAGNDIACQGVGARMGDGGFEAHYRLPNPIFMADSKSNAESQVYEDNRFVLDIDPSYVKPARWRDPAQAIEKARDAWAACLRRYTSRELTREGDKLQAISGLAEQYALFFKNYIREKPGELYIAGLWKHQMPHALCWKRDPEKSLVPRPKEYRAPSWSWASIDGIIYSATVLETFNFDILDIELAFKDPNYTFGRVVKGCVISARGLLQELSWDLTLRLVLPAGTYLPSSTDENGHPEIYLDAEEEILGPIFGVPVQRWCRPDYRQFEVYRGAKKLPEPVWKYHGLLLRKAAGEAECLERVGMFFNLDGAQFSVLWETASCSHFKII